MQFAHPSSLIWFAAAALIVAMYLWRGRRRGQPVGALFLWRAALERRSTWSRWSRWFSCAIHVAMLLAFALLLAEPFWATGKDNSRNVFLIIDASATMSAGAPSRLQTAKEKAKRVVESLGLYERAAVLAMGEDTRVVQRMTGDRQRLAQAIDSIEAETATGNLRRAFEIATAAAESFDNARIVIATDGQGVALNRFPNVQWLDAAAADPARENWAVANLAARRSSPADQDYEFRFAIQSFGGSKPVDCQVSLNGKQVSRHESIGEGGLGGGRVTAPQGGILSIKILGDDGLLADNQAAVFLPPPRRVALAIAGDEADWSQWRDRQLWAAAGDDLDNKPQVLTVVPPSPTGGDGQDGDVWIAPRYDSMYWTWRTTLQLSPLKSEAVVKGPTSSLTAGVDLSGVTVERVEQLEFAAGVEPIVVLASESNAPVCTLIRTDDGERLVWHAPLEGAAPELRELAEEVAARAIDRFADFTPTIYRAHRLGEAIALPPGDGPVSVQAPDATGIDAPADASFVRPTGQVGEWRIGGAPTPVHLMAGVESEMDWTSIEDDQSLYTPRSRTALWQWFACLAILLQVVEWAMRKFGWTI